MLNQSNQIKVCGEAGSNVPLVIGNCPHCGLGHHSLILTGFAMNGINPHLSKIHFTCVGCSKVTERLITEVAEDG